MFSNWQNPYTVFWGCNIKGGKFSGFNLSVLFFNNLTNNVPWVCFLQRGTIWGPQRTCRMSICEWWACSWLGSWRHWAGVGALLSLLISRWVVSDSANPWTVPHQALLSTGFPRQEYWSGLPFPSPGDLPDSGIKPTSPALAAGWVHYYWAIREATMDAL